MSSTSRPRVDLRQFAPSGPNYKPQRSSLTPAEFAYLKAYLNGHHDQNYASCPGVPFSNGNKTVMLKTTATATITPDVLGNLAFAVTGLLEAPVIISQGNNAARGHVIPYANVIPPIAYASSTQPGDDYMKYHGVEAYRNASLSVKVEDVTSALNRQGVIMSVRAPTGIDTVPIATSAGGTQHYARVLDAIPSNEDQMRSLSANIYIGPSEAGLYAPIPYSSPLPRFLERDSPLTKATYSSSTVATDLNTSVQFCGTILCYKNFGSGDLNIPVALGTPALAANNPNSPGCVCVSHSSNMTQYVLGTGLAATTTWRVSVVASWEMIVGAGTDWSDRVAAPMATNLDVLSLASDVFHFMPSAYPASANFWNDVWSTFKDVYRSSLSPLADMVISSLPANYQVAAKSAKALLDATTKRPEKQVPEKDPAPPKDMVLSATIAGDRRGSRR